MIIKNKKINDLEDFIKKIGDSSKQIPLSKTYYGSIKGLYNSEDFNIDEKISKLIIFSNEDLFNDEFGKKFEAPFLSKLEKIIKEGNIIVCESFFKTIPYGVLKEYIHFFNVSEDRKEILSLILEKKLKNMSISKRIMNTFFYGSHNNYDSQIKTNGFEFLKEKEKEFLIKKRKEEEIKRMRKESLKNNMRKKNGYTKGNFKTNFIKRLGN